MRDVTSNTKCNLAKMHIVFLLFFVVCSCPAEVVWETTSLELGSELTDPEVTGVFSFTVTGESPVSVTGIRPDCGGCTLTKLEKSTYGPGEHGEIRFVYSTLGHEGVQKKKITVNFADNVPAVILHFSVSVPYIFQARPRVLFWRKNQESSEQIIKLMSDIKGVDISDVLYDESKFVLSHKKAEDGVMEIRITPKTTQNEIKEKVYVKSSMIVGGKARETVLFLIIAP